MEKESESGIEKQDQDIIMSTTPENSTFYKSDSRKKGTTPGSGESPMTEEAVPSKSEEVKTMKPNRIKPDAYSLFFKRVSHLAAHKLLNLSKLLELSDEVKEEAWIIMKR